jgi:hypothetical protein
MRVQFHLLSFEGPDGYPRAGGIASRMADLAHALPGAGCETHLWFVGDPDLPGHEARNQTLLHLDWLLRQAQVRPQVTMLWNANNRTVEPVALLEPTGLGSASKRRQRRW